jgi:hypothetical protein
LAWKYFQLVGDRRRGAELLRQIPASRENMDELIDVAIGSDVDPEYGLELILQYRGTCDAITTLDQMIATWSPVVRDAAAARLVRHVHHELTNSLRTAIERSGQRADAGTLVELMESRPELFARGEFHLDPSHLAATVRLARLTTDRQALQLACELCQYGQRLDRSLVSMGEPPFVNWFDDHQRFLEATMGRGLDPALEFFSKQWESAPSAESRMTAAAVMVDLLCRQQHWTEALDWSLKGLNGNDSDCGVVPSALEIAGKCGRLADLASSYRSRGKLLMYGVALLCAKDRRE